MMLLMVDDWILIVGWGKKPMKIQESGRSGNE